ncbi:MAG: hypothetical protein JWO36_5821 [Myxococcales bacterium]|nr:hypothetical protein [Myxococcales bacterium]
MKMRTLRKLKLLAPRRARRLEFDVTDASMEPDPGPPPEAVFDRLTGPFDRRRAVSLPGAADEET